MYILFGGEMVQEKLRDGTLVRHKVAGYEGHIEGTTSIKELFTVAGQQLNATRTKETFQYRVVLEGETLRRLAPAADVEILEEKVAVPAKRVARSKSTTSK